MCIVAIAWQLFDELPLVLLSNAESTIQELYIKPKIYD